jgi:hypothetical protein
LNPNFQNQQNSRTIATTFNKLSEFEVVLSVFLRKSSSSNPKSLQFKHESATEVTNHAITESLRREGENRSEKRRRESNWKRGRRTSSLNPNPNRTNFATKPQNPPLNSSIHIEFSTTEDSEAQKTPEEFEGLWKRRRVRRRRTSDLFSEVGSKHLPETKAKHQDPFPPFFRSNNQITTR